MTNQLDVKIDSLLNLIDLYVKEEDKKKAIENLIYSMEEIDKMDLTPSKKLEKANKLHWDNLFCIK